MKGARRFLAFLVALTSLLAACDSPMTTAPVIPPRPSAGASAATEGPSSGHFPALDEPGRVFAFKGMLPGWENYIGWESTMETRYVLYDDGHFALQWSDAHPEVGEFTGWYVEEGDSVELHWYANSTMPPDHPFPAYWHPWETTATLAGGTLSVTYPIWMWLVGFLDAEYELEP